MESELRTLMRLILIRSFKSSDSPSMSCIHFLLNVFVRILSPFGTSDKASCLSVLPLQVTKVTQVEGDGSVRFSSETSFVVDKYEIL